MRRAMVFLTTFALALLVTVVASPSAAADGCSDLSVASGFRLLANRAPVTGAYSVDLPAGDYRLIASSFDEVHPTGADQQNETWYFTTDSGYTSPVVPDLPTGQTSASFDMGVITVPASTTITFHHGASGPGAQSVSPSVQLICASTPETTVPETTLPEVTAPDSRAPDTTPEPSVAPTTVPQTTTAPVPTAPPSTDPPEPTPPGAVLPAPSIVAPPTTAPAVVEPSPTTTEQGAVLPITITPDPPGGGDLARTGGGVQGVWLATFLIAAGVVLVAMTRPARARNSV